MPLFDYICPKCGENFERYVEIVNENVFCPICNEKANKLLSCPYFKTDTRGMFGRNVMGEAVIGKDNSFHWKRKPALKKEEVGGNYRTFFDMHNKKGGN